MIVLFPYYFNPWSSKDTANELQLNFVGCVIIYQANNGVLFYFF